MSPSTSKPLWQSSTGLIWGAFMVIALILLFTEHRAHALGVLLGLVVLACIALYWAARRAAK